MKKIFLILLLSLPAFALMLKGGIYTMHDFHLFRQFEFNKCISEGVFPCRWAPDAGLGYGEPLFNFYGQLPYVLGQVFVFLGSSIIDSVKFTFILSLALSGVSMYLLAKQFWGTQGALVSAVFYMYAPYRAVDVWVRGALPESLSFILFPLILYFLETRRFKGLSLSLALLIITHNLSLFMFLPFLGIWWIVRSRRLEAILAGIVSILLAAFYLIPVGLESSQITLSHITQDYYSYPLHFTSLFQLFVSRMWGYGGSTWGPNDTMSFSVGHIHWALPLFLGFVVLIKSKLLPRGVIGFFTMFVTLGLLAIFLTHGKSEIIWKTIPGLPYIQFPWRFLTMSTFFLSLAAGVSAQLLPRRSLPVILTVAIIANFIYFKPDIWKPVTDSQVFSGDFWNEQRSSALSDYWPNSAALPKGFAPSIPTVDFGSATIKSSNYFSHTSTYQIIVYSSYAKLHFPIVYFPGWTLAIDGTPVSILPLKDLGLISARIPQGEHLIELKFKDTFPRALGNGLSLTAFAGLLLWRQNQKRGGDE